MATRETIHDVIERFREAPSNGERGAKFERLMVEYFYTDPLLSVEYDEVCTWPEWTHNEHTHDSGIDLVARNREDGTWTAIQCKFYDPKHYLQKGDIDSFFTASGKSWDGMRFDNRIIISTTDRWSGHAETALANQSIPVQRISLADIAESPVDWMQQSKGSLDFEPQKATRYGLRPHQKEAIAKIQEGFQTRDRGQWISACGTGKTFTSLKLAEERCKNNGGQLKVLFLAPSISLVSQTLREWMAQTQTDIRPFVVCSDTKASKQAEDISVHDIPLPTTDAAKLASLMAAGGRRGKQMTVVFSTYQSIDVVAKAQRESGQQFDLILCDEAHRTTGVTLTGDEGESAFVKVHNNTYLPATKRLYMTATPRIYGEDVKKKADEHSALLTSMDDEATFGPEFHRLGFGQAVEKGLLTDYKVMILCVQNDAIADSMQGAIANSDGEISLDDASKIIGCWNGLAKRTTDLDFGKNPAPMQRAVAFAQNIKASKGFAQAFPELTSALADDADEDTPQLDVAVHHVDGGMNALKRSEELAWLKAPVPEGECRILSNARCLSEGVDVPALDAVLFLSPRNSLVDVLQSVGRVMRKAPGKDYGYIILPVAIDANESPDKAMRNNKRFKVVWDVLNALRAHDDRFKAMINSIDFDGSTGNRIGVDVFGQTGTGTPTDDNSQTKKNLGLQMPLFSLEMRDAVLARIVKKVGERDYWDNWTDNVIHIHANQVSRIKGIVAKGEHDGDQIGAEFEEFHAGLQANINDSIDRDNAIDMLSQHLITQPVFDALFPTGGFATHNPVSIGMQRMVAALEGQGLETETAGLEDFYNSVRTSAAGVNTPSGRQSLVHRLYEDFFKKAFPTQASSLGVVYTPVEIVDFILRAADDVCRQEFGYGLTDEGVHILDPFTGTGTFIVRLLESGIIRPEDLARKYASELWANEIMLLAYYIACVNIETTYQSIAAPSSDGGMEPAPAPYAPFRGATLTDTFQITEDGDKADTSLIPANNQRIEAQLAAPIRVILGNPPYSAGQTSANDNNANLNYPTLDARIADTYAKSSTGGLKKQLYDSYVRAFRWASDRISDSGIIAFVANNGWVDGNTAHGIRKSFTDEFSHIWVYNLRGNARTAGDLRKREGGGIFDSGARTGVAILIATKNPAHDGECELKYHGTPDYQTREEKLSTLTGERISSVDWTEITPNEEGDWLNQRSAAFDEFKPVHGDPESHFRERSLGVSTNRDAWCWSFSAKRVAASMGCLMDNFNVFAAQRRGPETEEERDPKLISWTRELIRRAQNGKPLNFDESAIRIADYRPFTREFIYLDKSVNTVQGKALTFFPTGGHQNLVLSISSSAGSNGIPLMHSTVSDLHVGGDSDLFPRWTYEQTTDDGALFSSTPDEVDEWGYRRVDNITDNILDVYQAKFGPSVTKDDIFFYVYGVLHSPQYRETFAADLKRVLPRIPLAASSDDFTALAEAGRRLSELHVGYEQVEPYPLHEQPPLGVDEWELYRVTKMKWQNKETKKALIYNSHITLGDIPAEAHEYMLGSRSALEWLIDRYQVKTDKASQIVNDPNDWAREHDDPRYIIDLIKRVTRVSVETMKIVKALPELPL
ncbi:DEAD/DEAH box helicase [Propionibacterium freudenreichii]|uniref:DEAD/DEAH box helicase n=1 Tax=Propionibacterium freudenreichii TaxID=1744 RepID=UPI000BEF10A6|nr:type ISP restriction/modification enzyme [Propionibacterium freudenreichii]MDK9347694.1 DEAD/DEAH box helicase [Propionibacterium freudenreichii]